MRWSGERFYADSLDLPQIYSSNEWSVSFQLMGRLDEMQWNSTTSISLSSAMELFP